MLTCLAIGLMQDLRAQTYPVTVDAMPSSFGSATVYLGDFAHLEATGMKINFEVELRDPVELFRQVHFRLHVERNGTTILMTDPSIIPPIITLQKDMPIMVNGADLAFYFDLNHLVGVSGTSLSNVLPEDFYSICIEVVDFVRQEVISERICASGFLEQLEPPLLYFPQQGMPLSMGQSVNLMFNWQLTGTGIVRMMNQPNISYLFELRELTPGLENVQEYFENNTLVYQTEVPNNSLIYGVGLPPLVEDKRYIWRVRALARNENGEQLVGYFHNNGISEIWDFTLPEEVADNDFCNAVTPQLPKNQNPVTQIMVDEVIHVGHFDMLVTELQNASGDAAKGTGVILIPFMDIQVETEFDNLKVNAKREAFGGRVQAVNTNDWVRRISGKADGSLDFSKTDPIFEDDLNQLILSSRVINEDSPNRLPLSLKEPLEERYSIDMPHDMIISELWFTPFGAAFNAFMLVPNGNGDFARFGVSDVGIDNSGFDISDLKLFLCEHTAMPGFEDDVIQIIAHPGQVSEDKGSFISFDCSGFQSFNLQGSYRFDKDILVRASNLSVPASATMHIQSEKWGDVFGSVNMHDFAIPGMEDWRFEVLNGFVDFSDEENIQQITLPANYVIPDDQWRGFYLSDLKVSLPHALKFGSNNALEMLSRHMVIDHEGVTFSGTGANLLPLGSGNAGGWGLSFDELQLNIESNEFKDAEIKGQIISVPIADTIRYNGRIFQEGEAGLYALDLVPLEDINISFLNARIEPDKESLISIRQEPPFCVAEWHPYTDINGPLFVQMPESSFTEFGEADMPYKIDMVKDSLDSANEFYFELSGVELKGLIINHPKLPEGRFFGIDRTSLFSGGVSLADVNLTIEGVDLLEEPFELEGEKAGLGLGFHVSLGEFGVYPKFWALNQSENEAGPYSFAKVEMEIPEVPLKAFACECKPVDAATPEPDYCQKPTSRLSGALLQPGAIVQVGHYFMQITSLVGMSGKGLMSMPFLGGKLQVEFENLETDANGMMTGGTVVSSFGNSFSSIKEEALNTQQGALFMRSIPDNRSFFEEVKRQNIQTEEDFTCPVSLTPFVHQLLPTAYEDDFEFLMMGIRFEAEVARVNCMVLFNTPEGDVLKFGISDLELRPDGFNLDGLRLYLAEEVSIPVLDGKSINLLTSEAGDPESGSYISYDCDGFQAFNLKGIYTFDKSHIVSADNMGNSVEAYVDIQTDSWGNYLGTAKMNTFSVFGMDDWSFEVLEAGVDFSDYDNLLTMQFPDGYTSVNPAWQGFFISKVKVTMPDELKFGDKLAISFDSENLLIDRYGVSGALNGISVSSPNLNSKADWAMSIDRIKLSLHHSRFIEAMMEGYLQSRSFEGSIGYSGRIYIEPASKAAPNEFYAVDFAPSSVVFANNYQVDFSEIQGYPVSLRKRPKLNDAGQPVMMNGMAVFEYKPFLNTNTSATISLPKGVYLPVLLKSEICGSHFLLNGLGLMECISSPDSGFKRLRFFIQGETKDAVDGADPYILVRQNSPSDK